MRFVKPQIFVLAETKIHSSGYMSYLHHIDASEFETDAKSGGERIIEIAGRACYRSFKPQMNKNVHKVREGNKDYIGNILNQKHGSVLEHATVTIACCDVSRILTHELVRHRAGTAYSQESGRYIRLDDIGMFLPECFSADWLTKNLAPHKRTTQDEHEATLGSAETWATEIAATLREATAETTGTAEALIAKYVKLLDLDNPKMPFHVKKELTSALRRLAPGGLTNTIIFTANHRTLRHLISSRTSEGAEEEIRILFHMIAMTLASMYPAIYQDMILEDGEYTCKFENEKI